MAAAATAGKRFVALDAFCKRQFGAAGKAPVILTPEQEFEDKINALYATGEYPLQPGYADFCKHIFVPNFADALSNILEITEENKGSLESGYEARTEKELAVLTRWFSASKVTPVKSKWLDVILYSRKQLDIENAAMGNPSDDDAPWGIVSIKPQDVNTELPMAPITMMRNALGVDQGGSGIPLEAKPYQESVAFWKIHANIGK